MGCWYSAGRVSVGEGVEGVFFFYGLSIYLCLCIYIHIFGWLACYRLGRKRGYEFCQSLEIDGGFFEMLLTGREDIHGFVFQ